ASVVPLVEAGRLKPLGIATSSPSPVLKDVPTITSAGVNGFEASGWYGLLAPAGTPPAVVEKLSEATIKVMNQPTTQEKLKALSVTPHPSDSSEFGQQIESETEKWKRVIDQAGITLG